MALPNKIVSIGFNQYNPEFELKERYRNSVKICRQRLIRQLSQLMVNMFEKLDDTLYKLADKAESDMVQSNQFDAMREVRRERETIESDFYSRMLEGYDTFWISGPDAIVHNGNNQPPRAKSLALVEKADLEEDLAVNNMILKGDNRFHGELYALDRRFSHMVNDLDVNGRNNPVAPRFICTSFRDASKCLSMEISIKVVIFKQFERELIENLGLLYNELNDYLTSADILPKLSRKIISSRVNPAAGIRSQDSILDGHVTRSELGEPGLPAESFSTLQMLLERNRGARPATQAVSMASLPIVDTREVLGALSSLQELLQLEQLATEDRCDLKSNLFQQLHITDSDTAERQIDHIDQDVIDLVSMLFEFILEDNNLPDAMKVLLGRLQIPLLKVAIQDKEFFSEKNHPARRLLDEMARAAIGWSEQHGRDEDGLYRRIESIVHQVNSEFDNDITVFDKLNETFKKFQEQESRGSQIVEKRTTQVTQGKERLTNAQSVVFTEIDARLQAHDDLPDAVVELLKDGWKDVLLLTSLRQGTESEEWHDALILMDKVIWSIEPKKNPGDKKKLLKDIPDLLKGLRQRLNAISFDQHRMTRIFREIQNCHVSALRGNSDHLSQSSVKPGSEIAQSVDQTAVEAAGPSIGDVLPNIPEAGDTDEEIEDEFLDQADALTVDSWLEVKEDGEKSAKRVKLAWKSDVTGIHLFVNRKGMKVAELTLSGLANWFRNGNAKVLENTDVPLMDRALQAMTTALKKSDTDTHLM